MYAPSYIPKLIPAAAFAVAVRYQLHRNNEEIRLDSPELDPLHIHRYSEIFFNLDKEVSFLVGDRLYPVATGNAIVSRADEVHMCIFPKNGRYDHFCLWIDAEKTSPLIDFFYTKPKHLYTFSFETQTRLRELFSALWTLKDDSDSESELKKASCLLQILVIFASEQSPATEIRLREIPQNLKEIVSDIHENFAAIERMEEISKKYFLSPATLERRFKKYLHISPKKFLESEKLTHAAAMLSEGASVTDACMQSGFSDCSYFIVLFKKKFGETPLKYKSRLKQ